MQPSGAGLHADVASSARPICNYERLSKTLLQALNQQGGQDVRRATGTKTIHPFYRSFRPRCGLRTDQRIQREGWQRSTGLEYESSNDHFLSHDEWRLD